MRRPSITQRLALLFGTVSTVSFLVLGLYLSSALEMHFEHMDRERLMATTTRIERSINEAVNGAASSKTVHERLDALMAGHDRVSMWIRRQSGELWVVDAPMSFPEAQVVEWKLSSEARTPALFTWLDEGQMFRGFAVRHKLTGDEEVDIVTAISIEEHRHFMAVFRRAMWIALAGAIVTTTLLGIAIARGSMRPMQRLTNLAKRVSPERLGEQLNTDDVPTELIDLATAFNEMLARLDDSFRRLSNFSSDIAHELRTPVSNLLTETQVTLSKQRDVACYRDVLASNAEELERLSRMVADMLFIAKADNGLVLPQREMVNLGRQIDELFEFFEALAEEKHIAMKRSGNATVGGDRLMLRRALNNLLANALFHCPENGTIAVEVGDSQEREVMICVRNTGIPLSEEECVRLFDRFYRADPARLRSTDGAGLGLAITKSIVTAHGGRIEARPDCGGNAFIICMPSNTGPRIEISA
jgi:two-component system heavy metal sensor histidine kinase CusS